MDKWTSKENYINVYTSKHHRIEARYNEEKNQTFFYLFVVHNGDKLPYAIKSISFAHNLAKELDNMYDGVYANV